MKTGYIIAVIGGIGLGLLIGSELTGTLITIIGAIFVVISLLSMIVLSYLEKKKSPQPVYRKHEHVDDLVKEFDDKELKPGSKEYKEIGEHTEMDYHHSDK